MKTGTHVASYLDNSFAECEMFQTKVVEKIKTNYIQLVFPKIVPFMRKRGKIL